MEYQSVAPLPSSLPAEDFDDMLTSVRPDAVVVTTPDHLHSDYLVRALQHGTDVIVEKPLTTDVIRAQSIAEAAEQSDAHVTMTFNYRYSPRNTLVCLLIADGSYGIVLSVHVESSDEIGVG